MNVTKCAKRGERAIRPNRPLPFVFSPSNTMPAQSARGGEMPDYDARSTSAGGRTMSMARSALRITLVVTLP